MLSSTIVFCSNRSTLLGLLIFSLLTFLFLSQVAGQSCGDNSAVSLANYSFGGGTHNYEFQLCIGGGVLGIDRGAAADTRSFMIATYKNGSSITLSGATPTLTSTETGVSMNGNIINGTLNSSTYGTTSGLAYIHLGGDPFTCVSSTALCGTPLADCFSIDLSSDVFLDSIKVFGIEGDNNPFAGCIDDEDLKIDLIAALPVEFTDVEARPVRGDVQLSWTTLSEINHDFFTVEYSDNAKDFMPLGKVAGAGSEHQETHYQYRHQSPGPGRHYYRIRQTDLDGSFSFSSLVEVEMTSQGLGKWQTVQTGERYQWVREEVGMSLSWQLTTMQGQVLQQGFTQEGSISFDLHPYPAGLYLAKIGRQTFKILRP